MTPVLGNYLRDKRWLPDRLEAVCAIKRGQAIEPRYNKNRARSYLGVDVMNINFAGGATFDGYENRVISILSLTGQQKVLKPPKLI